VGRRPYSAKLQETVPLHNVLVEAVKQSGMTTTQLADAAHVNRVHLADVLNGWSYGSVAFWQKVLDAAGVEIGWRHKVASNA
jgi:hypothetical protein